jgi:hypothetical protein
VCDHTAISDVSDLRGMPLHTLRMASTRVRQITGLGELPLRVLDAGNTRIDDITALRQSPITQLNLEGTNVNDLGPLQGARVISLNLSRTPVVSLEPLRGAPLVELYLTGCVRLQSVEPLTESADLERLVVPHHVPGVVALQKLPTLRFLSNDREGDGSYEQTAQQFWLRENTGNIAVQEVAPKRKDRRQSVTR